MPDETRTVLEGAAMVEAAILRGLEGKAQPDWVPKSFSAASLLSRCAKAKALTDELLVKRGKSVMAIDSVLLFRSNKADGGLMLRVTAVKGKDHFVCFRHGTTGFGLLSSFVSKLESGDVDWKLDVQKKPPSGVVDLDDEGAELRAF